MAFCRVWSIGCVQLNETGPDPDVNTGDEQRYWLIAESEFLVVDDFTPPGLGEILARADLPG